MRCVIGVFFLFSFTLIADDLAGLRHGQHVRVAMVGEGPLCEAAIDRASVDAVALIVKKGSLECGVRGEQISIAKDQIYQLTATRHLTKGRILLKALAGVGAVAALSAIPANSSDPEMWLLVANPMISGYLAYGASLLVPDAREYVLLITCPDRFHCFSAQSGVQQESPATRGEK